MRAPLETMDLEKILFRDMQEKILKFYINSYFVIANVP